MNTQRLLSILCLITLCTGFAHAQVKPPSAEERREAEKAWEALIKAKGGREKLHSITNMLTNLSASSTRLDIFPNLNWSLNHMASGRAIVSIADIRKNDEYFADENGLIEIKHGSWVSNHRFWRVAILMETKWDKPEPLRVRRISDGGKTFDVIETVIYEKRINFIYDPEEMLVLYVQSLDEKGVNHTTFLLSDYSQINGIQMPRTYQPSTVLDLDESLWKDRKTKMRGISFAFNVDYDPQLFKRRLRAGSRDDWKAKNKKQ